MVEISARLDPSAAPQAREPRSRQRRRMVLLAGLLISLLATGVSVASFFVPGAVVAAMFVAVFYGLLVAARLRDRRQWTRTLGAAGEPPAGQEPQGMEIEPDVSPTVAAAERAGFRVGVAVAAPIGGLALLLAAVLLDWSVVAVGAMVFFAIMIFMGAPVWLAAVEDEIEEAKERIGTDHPPSIR